MKQVGFDFYTYKMINEFQTGLEELENKIKEMIPDNKVFNLGFARDYLMTKERNANIPDEIYDEIDRLQNIRKEGIQEEKKFILAQAKLAEKRKGDKFKNPLTEEILSGDSLVPGFGNDVLEDLPNLQVYTHFLWYTERELDELIATLKENKKQRAEQQAEQNLDTKPTSEDGR